jgi:hypothetical protein
MPSCAVVSHIVMLAILNLTRDAFDFFIHLVSLPSKILFAGI